jgi:hypothetical protein
MRRGVLAGIGAIIVVAVVGIVWGFAGTRSAASPTPTMQPADSVMNSAMNSYWEKIVNQIGQRKATELQTMLTRDTIIMDKEAYSDDSAKWVIPNPQNEKKIQADYNQLLQMFPKQVKEVRANPQLVYNMVSGADVLPSFTINQATGKTDQVAGVVGYLYEVYQSSMYDLKTGANTPGPIPTPMQKLDRADCANQFAELNRILFGGEGNGSET